MTWFQSTRALKISAGLTRDEDLPRLMVAASDQLALDELVCGVRWMKWGAPFSLFIGFYTFCGHLRWEWVGGDTTGVKVPSCNEVRRKHPLMMGRALCVSQGRRGRAEVHSAKERYLQGAEQRYFVMVQHDVFMDVIWSCCRHVLHLNGLWENRSLTVDDYHVLWFLTWSFSFFFLPDSLTRDHSTEHSRSCYINRQTK